MNQEELGFKEKQGALNKLLDGEFVLVHLNTTVEGLIIPDNLKDNETITLKLSRWFRGAMTVEDDRIIAELLFDDSYFTCIIPFSAIWGLTGEKGENLLWPDAIPPEVLKKVLTAPRPAKFSGVSQQKDKKRPALRRVK